jgi:hypothetical protein
VRTQPGTLLVFGIVGALALWPPSVAKADWAYTHWGMTPDQVVAASGGTVALLPPSERTRNDYDGWELAVQGTYMTGSLRLPVGFTFDTKGGGLKCVMFNAMEDDVAALRHMMQEQYGKPAGESSFASLTTATWHTPDNIEFVSGETPLAAVVTHCRPK